MTIGHADILPNVLPPISTNPPKCPEDCSQFKYTIDTSKIVGCDNVKQLYNNLIKIRETLCENGKSYCTLNPCVAAITLLLDTIFNIFFSTARQLLDELTGTPLCCALKILGELLVKVLSAVIEALTLTGGTPNVSTLYYYIPVYMCYYDNNHLIHIMY